MKKIVISGVFALIFPLLSIAQTSPKLEEAYSAEELSETTGGDRAEVAFLVFKADHCYGVQDLSGKKDLSTYPDVSVLNEFLKGDQGVEISASNFSAEAFNPLLYDFGTNDKMTYYRVGDTGKLLKLYSDSRCRSLFKETK